MTQIAQGLTRASLISQHWQAGTIWFLICARKSKFPSLGLFHMNCMFCSPAWGSYRSQEELREAVSEPEIALNVIFL